MINTRLLLILIIFATNPAQAAVYKWVDEEGKVHFGDRPTSSQAEQIKLKKGPKSPNTPAPATQQRHVTQQRMLDMYQQEREKKKAAKKKQEEEAAKMAQECADARDHLRQSEGARLYENLPNGERRFFSDEERERKLSNLRAYIKRNCK